MILETKYHADWQTNRINFILSYYPKEFFEGKRILELGAYNGYIGAYFSEMGADVFCLEGREENINNIKTDYPFLKVEQANLDTDIWNWGEWDIIINFGLYYHLEKFHKKHLINCINNSKLMFFETLIFDSYDNEIFFRDESNDKFYKDQSLSDIGGTPSTKYVEDIFDYLSNKITYKKYTDKILNGNCHHYDWIDKNSKVFDKFARRFWIIKNK